MHPGRDEGRQEGRLHGKVEDLLKILEVKGLPLSTKRRAQVLACADVAMLDLWIERALTAEDAEVLFRQ